MDALAEKWSRSGRKSSDLYKGKTDEITKELQKWILKRQDWNAAVIKLLWDVSFNNDVIVGMPDQAKPLVQSQKIEECGACQGKNISQSRGDNPTLKPHLVK